MAILSGCQGKPQLSILEKVCPNCGAEIEMISTDTEARCERCGFVIYNDLLSCVQWCKYAKKCVGEEMYEHMMLLAQQQKARRAEGNDADGGKAVDV